MAKVRQKLPSDHIADVRNDVRQKLLDSGLRDKVKPGNRIAITAGSRGIGGLIELLSGIADAVKSCGGEPFIIPAMGSHGGATAGGSGRNPPSAGRERAKRRSADSRHHGNARAGSGGKRSRGSRGSLRRRSGWNHRSGPHQDPSGIGRRACLRFAQDVHHRAGQTDRRASGAQPRALGFGSGCAEGPACKIAKSFSAWRSWKTGIGSRAQSKSCRRPTTLFSKPTCGCCGWPKRISPESHSTNWTF